MAFDDELHIVLTVDSTGAIRSVRGFAGDLNKLEKELDQIKRKTDSTFGAMDKRVRSWSDGLGGAFSAAMGPIKAFGAAVGAVGGALTAFMVDSSRRAADFDALTAAIAAVEGSASTTARTLKELRKIASGPGLGVTEAITTYLGLRRAGLESGFSMRMTRELGNQVASSGGGKEVLGRVGVAMSQIANKPFLQGDEMLQLMEAGIPAFQMLKSRFGTSDTEELKKRGVTSTQVLEGLLLDMEKAPRVLGGAKNAWENLMDAVDMSRVSVGQGINSGLTGALNGLSDQINASNDAGVFRQLGENLIQGVADIFGDGDIKAALLNFVSSIDTAAMALRNLSLNASGLTENLPGKPGKDKDTPWWRKGFIDIAADAYRKMTGDENWDPWDPYGEQRSKRRSNEMQLELAEINQRKGGTSVERTEAERQRRRARGEFRWPNGTPSNLPDPTEAKSKAVEAEDARIAANRARDAEETRRKTKGAMDVTPIDGRDVARLKQQTLLEKIEQNTRRAADVMDRILGGGVGVQAAFGAVNLARWNDTDAAILNAQRHNGGAVVLQ
jgi:tape measure domain-containing protein